MGFSELFAVALGLSMDAFAVAVCKGFSIGRATFKNALIVGLYFGVFQAVMPIAGYFISLRFSGKIENFDHWIAFILLLAVGLQMLKDSRDKERPVETGASLNFKSMLPLAFATSVDALATGVSFAALRVSIIPAVSFIGVVTFVLSMAGVKVGTLFGCKYRSPAELTGGLILVFMGFKVLLG